MAWDVADVGSLQASPVCLGLHILIVQEVIQGFRLSPPCCHASPASGPGGGNPTPSLPCAVRSGLPPGAIAGSHRSPRCRSACDRCSRATPPAAICPLGRAGGAVRRPTVKPAPASRGAAVPASWSLSAARCSHPPWTQDGGLASARVWSRAREARCPIPRPCRPPAAHRRSRGRGAAPRRPAPGTVPGGPRGAAAAGRAPRLTPDLARVQAVQPRFQPGEVLVAARGRCADAHLARRVQAGVPAVRRVGARPIVACTPGRPCVRPRVRRTSAVKGLPDPAGATRSASRTTAWRGCNRRPSCRARQGDGRRPARCDRAPSRALPRRHPGFRSRQMTRVTTRLDAAVSHVADLARALPPRGQVDTSLAPLTTTRPRDGLHGQTGPGVLTALTVFAIVDNLVPDGHGSVRHAQRLGLARSSVLEARRWRARRDRDPVRGLDRASRPTASVEPRVKKRRPKRVP